MTLSRLDSLAEFLEPTDPNDKSDDDVVADVKTEVKTETTPVQDTTATETDGETKTTPETEVKTEGTEVKTDTTVVTDTLPKPDAAMLTLAEQNQELKQILRAQKKDLTILRSKLDRLEKKSIEGTKAAENESDNLFGDPADKATPTTKEDELTEFEVLQNQITSIATHKGDVLNTLLEVMELSPEFKDVKVVCSQGNFDDIFDAVGEAVAQKEGKDANIAAMEAELAVWKMPNPYKYMYNLIKKYHPMYAGKDVTATETTPADTKTTKTAKELLPAKAPTSVANVPGSSAATNAWTAARIDAMPEDELNQVPDDIYQKYLAGDLD